MTLETANELPARRSLTRQGYNSNSAMILAEPQKEHALQAVDILICIPVLERLSGFKPGTVF